MTELWKKCEGLIVDGTFPLREFLGGDKNHAVFLTAYGLPDQRKAAIKLIRPDPETTEAHLRRWRLASELSHPNLVRLYHRGRWQWNELSLLYVVVDFAEEDLSQVIPGRPLSPKEGREMLGPALSALAYLHSKNFVHGRLKPANFLAVDGQLKISSDSILPIGESDSASVDAYSPPELAASGPSAAGDVWSLGMTLVESLTQQRPAWTPAAPQDPDLPASLPAEFFDIARHALRWDPRKRWTVADMQRLLRQGGAKSAGLGRKRIYALVAGVAVLLVAMVAGPRLFHSRDSVPTAQPAPAAPAAQYQQPPPVAARPPRFEPRPAQAGPPRGEVLQQVLPEVLPRARNSIRGRVGVRILVEVNPAGEVVAARIDSRGPSRYFAERALDAAQRWTFQPSNVSREWMLRFEFTRNAIRAGSERVR